eukprot:gnl/MRDRNA2_/MRDRNA2_325195_c0_seq1.p1 gnl/MRDRNA2_/MRDRNA2_325195_c0~~gnl/MRDRNA2_/MRDRNA2_325195_c0_seq1.p1  ORF type:complete len:205 (+),score=11.85 gnl/MRDRNA2_/MRDRNA2_325195_c0_seq1:24-617(+)
MVLLASAYALHEIFDKDRRPALWFVVFGHVQLFLFGAIALAKSPWLCRLRHIRYPDLEAHCDVLRFTFLWRQFINILVSAFGLWVVTSFARVDMVESQAGLSYGVSTSPAKYRVASTRPMSSAILSTDGFRNASFNPYQSVTRPVSSRHLVTTPATTDQSYQLRPGTSFQPTTSLQPQSMSFASGTNAGLRPPVAVY